MSNKYYIHILTGMLVWLLACAPAYASVFKDFTKVEHKEHDIGHNGSLTIENQHGSIDISTWDKETASVEATITVHAESASKADEIFDFLDVDFITGAGYMKVTTEKEDLRKKGWRAWRQYLPWNIDIDRGSEVSYEVNYKVQIPASTKLNLTNRHGDITIPDMQKGATINLRYGDLEAASFEGDLSLSIRHGHAVLVNIEDLTAEVQYAKLKFEKARDIIVNSRYSKIYFDQADELVTESKYDKYEVGVVRKFSNQGRYDDYKFQEVTDANVTGKYSDYHFEVVKEEVDAVMAYGDFQVDKIEAGFDELILTGSHTDFEIGAPASYELQLNSEFTNVDMDERIDKKHMEKEGEVRRVNTSVGSGHSKIVANTKYGSFSIE